MPRNNWKQDNFVFIGPVCHFKRQNATRKKWSMSVVETCSVESDPKPSTSGPGKYAQHTV